MGEESRGTSAPAPELRACRTCPDERFAEYRGRRDFSVTPEPAPGQIAPGAGQPRFMVHKHHATRMHYDLRLEIDGALASWSVPRGPSYDPAVRRLAVETEEHPLEYGDFEGRIPEGEYGAGDSLVWDRGRFDTVPPGEASLQRARGRMLIELSGHKLVGRWHLVRTRGRSGEKSSWLLFKARDEHADPDFDVVTERPESVVSGRVRTRGPERARVLRAVHPPPVMLLADVVPVLPSRIDPARGLDVAEFAWALCPAGERTLAAVSGRRALLASFEGRDLTPACPRVAAALAALVIGEALFDGVLAAPGSSQEALWVLDLLRLDDEDLRARPLEERLDLLASLLGAASSVLRPVTSVGPLPLPDALALARRAGAAALLARRRGSFYPGGRSHDWLELAIAPPPPHHRSARVPT